MERRTTMRGLTVRADGDGGAKKIGGYAAVFYDGTADTEYELWPGVRERVGKGAFDRALAERHDAVALFNHDPNVPLARVSAGTLALAVDGTGLRYEATPAATQQANDLLANIQAGNVRGSSFSFRVRKETWEDMPDGSSVRTLEDVDLYDVSPVVFPAYEGTTVAARDADGIADARRSLDAHRAARKAEETEQMDRRITEATVGLAEAGGVITG